MSKNIVQIPSKDGCIYIYDIDTGKAQKLCDISGPMEFPDDVKETLTKLQRLTMRT